jgi:phosphatidylethanolamine-binding protein (PEBP) family uncharacterized protein
MKNIYSAILALSVFLSCGENTVKGPIGNPPSNSGNISSPILNPSSATKLSQSLMSSSSVETISSAKQSSSAGNILSSTLSSSSSLASIIISPRDWSEGSKIPQEFACASLTGQNQTPAYSWSYDNPNTLSWTILVVDETTPCGKGQDACVHWSILNLLQTTRAIDSFKDYLTVDGALEGINYNDESGWAGPCPSNSIEHTYTTIIYALDIILESNVQDKKWTAAEFESTYSQNILATGVSTATH